MFELSTSKPQEIEIKTLTGNTSKPKIKETDDAKTTNKNNERIDTVTNSFLDINFKIPPELSYDVRSNIENSNIINSNIVISTKIGEQDDIYINNDDYITYMDLMDITKNTDGLENDSNEKCCFMNKFRCNGDDCKSGLEKRCGVFADKLCSETTHICDNLDKLSCTNSDNSNFCDYDKKNGKCIEKVNPHDGFEISCEKYERFKKIGDFAYINEMNCVVPLLQ